MATQMTVMSTLIDCYFFKSKQCYYFLHTSTILGSKNDRIVREKIEIMVLKIKHFCYFKNVTLLLFSIEPAALPEFIIRNRVSFSICNDCCERANR